MRRSCVAGRACMKQPNATLSGEESHSWLSDTPPRTIRCVLASKFRYRGRHGHPLHHAHRGTRRICGSLLCVLMWPLDGCRSVRTVGLGSCFLIGSMQILSRLGSVVTSSNCSAGTKRRAATTCWKVLTVSGRCVNP